MDYKTIKRGLLAATSMAFIFSTVSFAQFKDVPANAYYTSAVENLSTMGVIKGFQDGTFKPSAGVSRAEFVKMIISATGKDDEAAAAKGGTVFPDVKASYWASGYINLAIKNNIITGYADGTFKPEEKVDFAQVVTVLLRTLGYGSSDMTGVWPDNYIEKAKGLDITKGLNLKASDKVNRANAAVMIERMLNCDVKDSTKTLAEQSDLGTTKTCIITDSSDIDSILSDGTIKTDIGDFSAQSFSGIENLGKKLEVLVDSNNQIISIKSTKEDSHVIFVDSISGNKVSYYDKKSSGTVTISDGMTFYYDGNKKTFADIKQSVSPGSIIALSLANSSSGVYDYGVLVDPSASEPVVATKDVEISDKTIGKISISDRSAFKVIKEGKSAVWSDIKMYDVVYLVKSPFKTSKDLILVYDDKTTGTYDDAMPSKNSVSSIQILGKELEIETSYAASKLNDCKGAFEIGDQITVLTGKSGKIVDVISPSSSDISNIGIILSTRKSTSTDSNSQGKQLFYAKIYKTDGTVTEYRVDEDQTFRKGKLVRFDIKLDSDKNQIVSTTPIVTKTISGTIGLSDKMIGDKWLSSDAVILDLKYSDDSQDAQVKKLTWQDMPSGELTANDVIDAEAGGAFGDIQLLVLDNFTEAGQYGIIKTKTKGNSSANYTFMIDGEETSFNNVETKFYSNQGDVVYMEQDSDGLTKMVTLSPKASANDIQAADSKRIKINDKIYKLANDVQIYDITSSTPTSVSIDDLSSGKVSNVSLYTSLKSESENLIKIITFRR